MSLLWEFCFSGGLREDGRGEWDGNAGLVVEADDALLVLFLILDVYGRYGQESRAGVFCFLCLQLKLIFDRSVVTMRESKYVK